MGKNAKSARFGAEALTQRSFDTKKNHRHWNGTGMVLENGKPSCWIGLGMVLQVLEWSWNGTLSIGLALVLEWSWNGTLMVVQVLILGMVLEWYSRYWNRPGIDSRYWMVLQVLDLEWYPRYWNGLGMTGKDADATREA